MQFLLIVLIAIIHPVGGLIVLGVVVGCWIVVNLITAAYLWLAWFFDEVLKIK
jgi:hypothetical protein